MIQHQKYSLSSLLTDGQVIRLKQRPEMKDNALFMVGGNSFVVLIYKTKKKETALRHCNLAGRTLFEYPLALTSKMHFPQIMVLSENQVLITEVEQNRLTQIDLQTHEVLFLYHKFKTQHEHFQNRISLHVFSETKLLCVAENTQVMSVFRLNEKAKQLKFTYYSLPLLLGTKPWVFYQTLYNIRQNFKVDKANDHSMMMIWFSSFSTVHAFDLRNITDKKTEKFHIEPQSLMKSYNWKNIIVLSIWQKKRGQLLLACQVQNYNNCTQFQLLKFQIENECLKKAGIEFAIPNQSRQLIYVFNLGECCFINSLKEEYLFQSKFTIDYTLYVNNTEEILQASEESLTDQRVCYFAPTYYPGTIYKVTYKKNKEGWRPLSLIQNRIVTKQELILHLLLQMNEDFDDDLLKDTVELIDYNQNNAQKNSPIKQHHRKSNASIKNQKNQSLNS